MKVQFIKSEQTHLLRHTVLWQHKADKKDCFLEVDKLETTFHTGCLDTTKVVGVATFLEERNDIIEGSRQYRLRAMATDLEYRRKGIGKELLVLGLKKLKEKKIDILWCDARLAAVDFYKANDFVVIGDTYEVKNIGLHKLMYKIIKQIT